MIVPNANGGTAAHRRVLVIHNAAAGRARESRFNLTIGHLRRLGCRPEVCRTGAPGDAEALARQAAAGGYSVVVAAGGDGTINETINGLAGSGVPLALLPLGTANVLATEIGLSLDPERIAATIARGAARPVSLGRVASAAGPSRLFSLMVSAGVDAHVVADVDLSLKRRIGKGAYVLETLRQLAVFPFPGYRVTLGGVAYEAASVVVAKARHYGGAFVCAPAARIDDASFHVCLFERSGPLAAARYALALMCGRLVGLPDYRILKARRVRIEGLEGDPVQGDGDIIAALPLDIEMVPRALALVMPPAPAF